MIVHVIEIHGVVADRAVAVLAFDPEDFHPTGHLRVFLTSGSGGHRLPLARVPHARLQSSTLGSKTT